MTLDDRGARAANALRRDLDHVAVPDPPNLGDHPTGRRRALVALAVFVLVVLVAVPLLVREGSGTDGQDGSFAGESQTPTSSEANEVPSDVTRRQFREWLSEYDPEEVQYLKNLDEQVGASSDVVSLVVTLEFRRACRTFASIFDGLTSGHVDAGEAEATMNEQVARLDERSLPGDQAAEHFSEEFQELQAGNLGGAAAFLDSGTCSRAFNIIPRR